MVCLHQVMGDNEGACINRTNSVTTKKSASTQYQILKEYKIQNFDVVFLHCKICSTFEALLFDMYARNHVNGCNPLGPMHYVARLV